MGNIKRHYKIVEEKKQSENFSRFIPKYIYGSMLVNNDCPKWNVIPYDSKQLITYGYVKSREEAETIIDNFENEYKEIDNNSVVNVIHYEPKAL